MLQASSAVRGIGRCLTAPDLLHRRMHSSIAPRIGQHRLRLQSKSPVAVDHLSMQTDGAGRDVPPLALVDCSWLWSVLRLIPLRASCRVRSIVLAKTDALPSLRSAQSHPPIHLRSGTVAAVRPGLWPSDSRLRDVNRPPSLPYCAGRPDREQAARTCGLGQQP